MKITITIDTSWVALGLTGAAAAYMLLRARFVKNDTVWWIRTHKRYSLTSSSPDDLMVITDFDATLTTGDSEQCHDMIGFSKLMSEPFRRDFEPLLDWTNNAAIDGVEWWDKAHSYMVKHGQPTRQIVPRLVREAKMKPRPGSLELLKKCEDLNVPVLIVSAGVTDIIEEYLRQHGALSENVAICSNRLNYEGDSTPKSVSPDPPITSFTKTTAYKSANSFFTQHSSRRTLIVMGDSITDVDPAKEVPSDKSLSIGFTNKRPDRAAHANAFDAVVMGDQGSLSCVHEIIDEMRPGEHMPRSPSVMPLVRKLSSKAMHAMSGASRASPAS